MAYPAPSRDQFESGPGRRVRRSGRPHQSRSGPWKHGVIPVIGLIGGIGSGKSLAAAAFARRQAFVLDADVVGHSLLEQRPTRELILQRFGPRVLADATPDDEYEYSDRPRIDRKVLGSIVFDDRAKLRALESILHPRMRRTFAKAIARTIRRGQHTAVVLDAAVLLEAGWDDLCDLIVFLDAPRELRLARLASSRGWTPEVLARREAAQLALDLKRDRATTIITNAGEPEQLDRAVSQFWDRHIRPVAKINKT